MKRDDACSDERLQFISVLVETKRREETHRWEDKIRRASHPRHSLPTVTDVTHRSPLRRRHTQDKRWRLTLYVGPGRGGAVVREVLQHGGVPGEAQQHLGRDEAGSCS